MRSSLVLVCCVALLACPDKRPEPKALVTEQLGMTMPLPDGVVADPDSAQTVVGTATISGASNVETRAWKHPTNPALKVVLSRAELAVPRELQGAAARDVFELVLAKSVATTDRLRVKTESMQPTLLERGMAYSWRLQAEGARVVMRGLLVYDGARPGLVNSTAQCSCLPEDLPSCERAIEAATFETPKGAALSTDLTK